ncbi:hypothetical protein NLJ89_g3147 [Agrocybe chaxingu]|uniref:Uncharacterized protein n=1 Tax=Agrocybe chaxingu TaxID=84603 RepID=A0A9W8K311_9AGAR|nr:hypothetical protein NLJ89_g3147 [Agrocybe chaxingu]
MAPKNSATAQSSGLLAGVFSFVSREFDSFVANATGSSAAGPSASALSDEDFDDYTSDERDATHDRSIEDYEPASPPRKRLNRRNIPAVARHQNLTPEGEVVITRRRHRVKPGDRAHQRTRVASSTLSPAPSSRPEAETGASTAYASRPKSRTRQPHSRGPSTSQQSKLLPLALPHLQELLVGGAAWVLLSKRLWTSPHARGLTRYTEPRRTEIEDERPRSRADKGKGRATEDFSQEYETSGFFRVKGKERELIAAREEMERNDRRSRRDDEGELTFLVNVEEDRNKDKERIRVLEEEIARLKEELMKRPPNSEGRMAPPPPPLPPPPPPPRMTTLGNPGAASDQHNLFASARASLKQAPTPVENPINPPAAVRRRGVATMGVAPDKMAAFLQEMKTVRLRKVGRPELTGHSNSLDREVTSDSSLRRSISLQRSVASIPPPSRASSSSTTTRTSHLPDTDSRVGEKRKRALTDHQEEPPSNAAPTSSSNTSSQSETSSFTPLSQSYPARTSFAIPQQPWQTSSVTDAPTPSLCSDNSLERDDTSPDEQPPSTPPAPATTGPSRSFFRFRGNGIPVEPATVQKGSVDVVMEDSGHRDYVEPLRDHDEEVPAPSVIPNKSTQSRSNIFDKRPPSSPFPDKSPRRPRPPTSRTITRPATPRPPPRAHSDEDEDEDDPLSLPPLQLS